MAVLRSQIIERALAQTSNERDAEVRRRAVRSWLQAEGFSKSSIDESDLAIRSAVDFALGLTPAQNPPPNTEQTKEAPPPIPPVSDNLNLLRNRSGQTERAKAALKAAKSHPQKSTRRGLSWPLAAIFFGISLLLGFYVAPGATPADDFPRVLLTVAGFSVVAHIIGRVFWSISATNTGYLLSAAVAVLLAPSVVFAISVVDQKRVDSPVPVPMVLTEHGPDAIVVGLRDLFDGGEGPRNRDTSGPNQGNRPNKDMTLIYHASLYQRDQSTSNTRRVYDDADLCTFEARHHPSTIYLDSFNDTYCQILDERPVYYVNHTCGSSGRGVANILMNRTIVLFAFETPTDNPDWQEMLADPSENLSFDPAVPIPRLLSNAVEQARRPVMEELGDQRTIARYWTDLDELRRELARYNCYADDASPPR